MDGREAISGAGTAPPQPQPQPQPQLQPQPLPLPQPQPQPPSAAPPSSATPAAPKPGTFSAAPPPTELVKVENASQSFGVDATGPAPATAAPSVPPPATVPPATAPMRLVSPPGSTGSMMMGMGMMKKKRGRPRKYAPDGSLVMPLSLMPPMSVASPTGEFTLTSGESITMSMKRGRGRAIGVSSFVKQYARPEYESPPPPPPPILGELSPFSYGGGFMPHIINVAAGEDVTMKIISFSQQGPRAICILSATGVISNVTLRQPDSSGGTLTYEGRFELLSLSGSFMPNDIGGARSRSGGMSVSLASPDGRVVGGGVAGLLVAASPVQVVVGSFMPSHQAELKSKKPKLDSASVNSPPASAPISSSLGEPYNGGQGQHNSSGILKPSITTTSLRESWASLHPISDTRNSTDINISLPNA